MHASTLLLHQLPRVGLFHTLMTNISCIILLNQLLEKKFGEMEGYHVFGAAAKEMYLISGLVIPAKFKTPDFDKYNENTCLKSYLIMYYVK